MSSSLDDLWDDPVVEEVQKRQKTPDAEDSPRPTKRLRQTLFLPGSDDDRSDVEVTARLPPQKDIDIDAIFDGIDDEDDDTSYKPLKVANADDMERQMEAQYREKHPALTPHQVMPSSSPTRDTGGESKGKGKDEKKPRRKPLLLNEGLLLGPKGFPELIKSLKDFKVKGKGHEASDLNRILGVYQFWTHGLYPKTQFRDTAGRIEKICHSKRMQVALSVWKDEAKGLPTQAEDSEDEDMEPRSETNRQTEEEGSNTGARTNIRSSSTSPPPSRPPSSASEYDDIFDDMDALLQQESSISTGSGGISGPSSLTNATASTQPTTEDDDTFWATIDELEGGAPNVPTPPPKEVPMDEDQEMWDIVDDVTKNPTVPQPSPPPPAPSLPQPGYADPEDWDDMYV